MKNKYLSLDTRLCSLFRGTAGERKITVVSTNMYNVLLMTSNSLRPPPETVYSRYTSHLTLLL